MNTIIVGFSRSTGIFSRAIRLITGSKVSHTYMRFPTGLTNPTDLIYQASKLSVNVESIDNFLSKSEVVDEIILDVEPTKYAEILSFLLSKMGKPYSMKQIVGMLWVLGWRGLGVKVANPFRDKDHSFICVELVARALDIPNAEELSPQDLWELLETMEAK